MRSLVFVPVLLMAVLLLASSTALAADVTVTLSVVGADGQPLANALVTIYNGTGSVVAEGTTDASGKVNFTLAEATYLVAVKGEYYVLDTISVTVNVAAFTINASAMNHANLTSTPRSVDIEAVLLAFSNATLKMTTNVTVYAPSSINVTYPQEVVAFPFKYVFEKIVYDTAETNKTTVTLDMAKDYAVVAHYTRTFYLALEYWMVIILVLVLIIALAVAWSAGAKAAKAMIEEWRERSRRFVRRKR